MSCLLCVQHYHAGEPGEQQIISISRLVRYSTTAQYLYSKAVVLDVLTPLSDCRQEPAEKMERRISGVSYVYVLDGFLQRDFLSWVFMCTINFLSLIHI